MSGRVMIKQSSMVKPAEEAPRRSVWLSSLDLTIMGPHFGTFYVYHPQNNPNPSPSPNPNPNPNPSFFDMAILKESLSQALVPFYTMAGRLKEGDNGRMEIDCNGQGALLVEVETSHCLEDLGEDFTPTRELMRLVVPSCDYSKGHDMVPLLMVQLTRFKCGGVIIGFAIHHRIGDGVAHLHFVHSWARLARGLPLELVPNHERTPYLQPRNPPQVDFLHSEYDPPKAPSVILENETTTTSLFKITNDQINVLKQKAAATTTTNSYEANLTTYEVLTAHILGAACKARGLSDDEAVKLYIPVDGRSRLKNPTLPQGFSGNAIFTAVHVAKSGDITSNPLGHVASKIRQTLEKMKNEDYLRSTIDYLESHPNIASLARGSHTFRCPNFLVNSWLKLPSFYELDFGWGKPLIAG